MNPSHGRRILVVEDDASLAQLIRTQLEGEGYVISVANDGDRALQLFESEQPALMLLDLMLPGTSGLDVCRSVRKESIVPIIIMSGKDGEIDKILALELGADDYMTKPFSMPELVSRIRAKTRRAEARTHGSPFEVLETGSIRIDVQSHDILVRGRAVSFSPKEFALLEELMRARGGLRTVARLSNILWGSGQPDDAKILHAYISRIRQKVEVDPNHPTHLITVRGLGYRLIDRPVDTSSPTPPERREENDPRASVVVVPPSEDLVPGAETRRGPART